MTSQWRLSRRNTTQANTIGKKSDLIHRLRKKMSTSIIFKQFRHNGGKIEGNSIENHQQFALQSLACCKY